MAGWRGPVSPHKVGAETAPQLFVKGARSRERDVVQIYEQEGAVAVAREGHRVIARGKLESSDAWVCATFVFQSGKSREFGQVKVSVGAFGYGARRWN